MRKPNDSWRPVVIFVASVNLVVAYILLLTVFKSFFAPVEGLLIGGKPVTTTQQRVYGMVLTIVVIAAAGAVLYWLDAYRVSTRFLFVLITLTAVGLAFASTFWLVVLLIALLSPFYLLYVGIQSSDKIRSSSDQK